MTPGTRGRLVPRRLRLTIPTLAACLAAFSGTGAPARAAGSAGGQGLSKFDRDQGRMILTVVRKDLTSYYYDSGFHGLSLDEVFSKAGDAIDRAGSHAEIFTAIAGTLRALDDSHTFFVPPGWAATIEFGWGVNMVGEQCFLDAVQPGSDADAQGLKKGDLVLSIDGVRPTRDNLSDMMYDQRVLMPRASSQLVLKSPTGPQREVIVRSKVLPQKRVFSRDDWHFMIAGVGRGPHQEDGTRESGDLTVWKLSGFDVYREEIGRTLARARKHKSLILDLRGNPGGAVVSLEFLAGGLIGDKVKIGDVKSRLKVEPIVSRKPAEVFAGKLIVLVDYGSGSAAEIFARQMQLSGRGTVLGDRSSGSVMESQFYDGNIGSGPTMLFGSSITVADIIMSDGKSLEKTGVTPDETLLPTGEDLANDRDPVLAHAAGLCGVTMEPSAAGALFPFKWK
jgi:C-terminal processing protease CtpA/Prc